MPTVAIGDEKLKLRQLCLVYSVEFPLAIEKIDVSHEIKIKGDVQGLSEKFLNDSYEFTRPDALAAEDLWQVITYITSEKVEISGDAMILAKIKIGDKTYKTDLRFYNDLPA